MKVLFQTRVDTFERRGGDTVQMEKTAEELRNLGINVDIINKWDINLSDYDLVHLFQLDWICEPYLYALNAKKQKKPIVISPIHHSEKEVVRFEKYQRYDFKRFANLIFRGQEGRDVLKNIYRSIFDLRKMYPTFLSIIQGYRKQQKEVLQMSDLVLVQTKKEVMDLKEDFGIDIKWKKVVNGVGDVFLSANPKAYFDFENYVVTIGRIEPRKNQLKIIEAVKKIREEKNVDLKLVIIGELSNHNLEYVYLFKKLISKFDWITYIKRVDYNDMPSVYKGAKVCVSASFFETSGLTLIEAVLSSCNVVAPNGATGERVKEYLGNIPFYCDVTDVESIKDAIYLSYKAKKPVQTDEMKTNYTWRKVAEETLEAYNKVLKKGVGG